MILNRPQRDPEETPTDRLIRIAERYKGQGGKEAKAKGLKVGVGKFPWAASGRATSSRG